jgi:hypothetical protein
MRSAKQSDSPSGATRDVYPLRPAGITAGEIDRWLEKVGGELRRLVKEQPHLLGQDPRGLLGRIMTPELAPDYESCLRAAAFAVLRVRAQDRAEHASPTSGDAA